MRGMSNKTATIFLILVVGLTMLTFLCYAAIFIVPEIPFNPYRPSYATARAEAAIAALQPPAQVNNISTATATSVFGPTWTPTNTPVPTQTPTPTETRTPTPTSSPTPTSTPFPTKTPTPTDTPLPPTPTTPPTATPPPLYTVGRIETENNCSVVRILGIVRDAKGLPLAGVTMQVGEVGVAGSVFNTSPSDANGRYVWDFGAPDKNAHTWFVVPLENGQPAVNRYEFATDSKDVCDSFASVQITTIDWQRRPDIVSP